MNSFRLALQIALFSLSFSRLPAEVYAVPPFLLRVGVPRLRERPLVTEGRGTGAV